MAYLMMTLLKQIFIENWVRKMISLIAAIAVWFIVDNALKKSSHFTSINTNLIEEVR